MLSSELVRLRDFGLGSSLRLRDFVLGSSLRLRVFLDESSLRLRVFLREGSLRLSSGLESISQGVQNLFSVGRLGRAREVRIPPTW